MDRSVRDGVELMRNDNGPGRRGLRPGSQDSLKRTARPGLGPAE